MKKYLSVIIIILVFVVGLSIFLYPVISDAYNNYLNKQLLSQYSEVNESISPDEYDKMLENAHTYNKYLNNKEKLSELGLSYESLLNPKGDGMMGYIEIPKISVKLPIYHTLDANNLQMGLGHKEDTALPVGGEGTHCVLAGHTGLPSAKLLTSLDRLENGDLFFIHILSEVLTYRVDDMSIVEPDETSKIQAVSGKDYLTIVTCTPYGINTHRLLVRGVRVQNGEIISGNGFDVPNDIRFVSPLYLLTAVTLIYFAVYFIVKIIAMKKKKSKVESSETDCETNDEKTE